MKKTAAALHILVKEEKLALEILSKLERGIGFDRREKGDQKRQLRGGFAAAYGNPLYKRCCFVNLREDLFHAEAVRHGCRLLLA